MIATGADGSDEPEFMVCQSSKLVPLWQQPSGFREGQRATSASFHSRFVAFGTWCGDAVAGTLDQQYGVTLSRDRKYGTVVAFSPLPDTYPIVFHAGESGIKKTRLYGPGEQTSFPGSYQGDRVTSLVLQQDGASFFLGNAAGTVQRWQVEPPQLLWQTNFPNNWVSGINLLPDGRQIVTLSSNLTLFNGEYFWSDVRVWEIGQTNFLLRLRPDLPLFSTSLTPDGRCLFTVLRAGRDFCCNPIYYTNHIVLWRVSDTRPMGRYDQELPDVVQLAVAPDGKSFAYGRGDGIIALARIPVVITNVVRRNAQAALEWQGGSGLYQVQQTSNVASSTWENLGSPTTNTNATVPATNPAAFFRVQSLTNAP
jgi:hypothetical protein